jgi:hypothetical protein
MNAIENQPVHKMLWIFKWANIVPSLSLVISLCIPWILKFFSVSYGDVGFSHSFIQRAFLTPQSYLPILLTLIIVLAIAIFPSKLRLHRSLVAGGILIGLGLAIVWAFDGGLGNVLLSSGLCLFNFGVLDSREKHHLQPA